MLERRNRKNDNKYDGKVDVMVSSSTSLSIVRTTLVSTESRYYNLTIPRHSSSTIGCTLINMDSNKDTGRLWILETLII